ncbi:MAG: S1/P1 Nuclease, partial [Caulobacteraceae bacterium]
MDDNAFVMSAAGPSIDALPRLKSEYDAALTAAGLDVDDAGYLPYAIWDGYQNLVRDFAYWRVLTAQEARETDPQKRAWYRVDRERREALIVRDMGVLGHYVGDGAQPHHTTIHYNGWDRNTPNPEGFTTSRQTHGAFEGAFTARVARLDVIEAAMTAPRLDGFDLRARVPAYLRTTLAEVMPFYRLEKAGAFRDERPDAATFTVARLGAGASELRDLYILAWRDSADDNIGWPAVKVAEVEAGTADPWLAMYGED